MCRIVKGLKNQKQNQMRQRGRKSKASLNVVPVTPPMRPQAPAHLVPEEAQWWRLLVNDMPPDHFTSALFLLEILCCQIRIGQVLAGELHEFDERSLLNH